MMCFISCKTTEVIEKNVYYVPEVNWPTFPNLENYERSDNGKVTTDEKYFRKLLMFKTQYVDAVERYNENKERMEKKNEL